MGRRIKHLISQCCLAGGFPKISIQSLLTRSLPAADMCCLQAIGSNDPHATPPSLGPILAHKVYPSHQPTILLLFLPHLHDSIAPPSWNHGAAVKKRIPRKKSPRADLPGHAVTKSYPLTDDRVSHGASRASRSSCPPAASLSASASSKASARTT